METYNKPSEQNEQTKKDNIINSLENTKQIINNIDNTHDTAFISIYDYLIEEQTNRIMSLKELDLKQLLKLKNDISKLLRYIKNKLYKRKYF